MSPESPFPPARCPHCDATWQASALQGTDPAWVAGTIREMIVHMRDEHDIEDPVLGQLGEVADLAADLDRIAKETA